MPAYLIDPGRGEGVHAIEVPVDRGNSSPNLPELSTESGRVRQLVRTAGAYINVANVPDRTLKRALGETTRILVAAGIETVWELYESDSPEAHSTDFIPASIAARQEPDSRDFLVVRLIRGFPKNSSPNDLGFWLPAARTGAHVTIFYDRIEDLGLAVKATAQKILGNALAHEMGHVLLGSGQHSQTGIMQAVWTRAVYQHLSARFLEFQPHQILTIRQEVSTASLARKRTSALRLGPRRKQGNENHTSTAAGSGTNARVWMASVSMRIANRGPVAEATAMSVWMTSNSPRNPA